MPQWVRMCCASNTPERLLVSAQTGEARLNLRRFTVCRLLQNAVKGKRRTENMPPFKFNVYLKKYY